MTLTSLIGGDGLPDTVEVITFCCVWPAFALPVALRPARKSRGNR